MEKAKKLLREARIRAGPEPVSPSRNKVWQEEVEQFKTRVDEVNKNVDRLNLVAPSMYQQQVRYVANKEIEKVSRWYEDQIKTGQTPTFKEPEVEEKLDKNENKKRSVWQGIKGLFSSS